MQPLQPPHPDTAQCPICRARVAPALPFCPVCGAQLDATSAHDEEELRGVLYLLSELERWHSSNEISEEQAARLRSTYERRRDELRSALAARENEKRGQAAPEQASERPPLKHTEQAPQEQQKTGRAPFDKERRAHQDRFVPFPARQTSSTLPPPPPPPRAETTPVFQRPPARTLFERLADPHTLRLMLYTGAAMLTTSIVLLLRDILYQKLQEPIVQAGLLAFGTAAFTFSGWYITLRTRQRWTGRALTLAGSLLVPVNFWFLVRSGLIENHGRAWVVCAFCTLLYAHTAALLRERLYVYLSCAATVATLWALILRDAPRAFGLYALALMTCSLVFLHLARLFPPTKDEGEEATEDDEEAYRGRSRAKMYRWSRELWSTPLMRMAIACATLSVIIYLPLRFMPDASSFYSGIFRLRASAYDPSIALLILAGGAYVLWFAGRYLTSWSKAFYTLSALVLFLAGWTACDGFRLAPESEVFTLALIASLTAIIARTSRSEPLSVPLRHASLIVSIVLAIASIAILLNAPEFTAKQSASLALVAACFAVLSTPRFYSRIEQSALAHSAALYFSASYFIALASASLKSETLIVTLCAAWPLALYGASQLALKLKREEQLAAPFTRVADAEAILLLLWSSIIALLIHVLPGDTQTHLSVLVALAAATLYGALRSRHNSSVYGTLLGTAAAVITTAAALDELKRFGVWPASWPIAAGTIVFAFILERTAARFLRLGGEDDENQAQPLVMAMYVVLDMTVAVCAILWLVIAFARLNTSGFGAPSVLLLALLYWVERALENRTRWPVYITCAHMGAFLVTLLIALRVDPAWLDLLFVLTIFPTVFVMSRVRRAPLWLREPLSHASVVALLFSLLFSLLQASPHLEAGDAHLLAPSLTTAAVALLSFIASIFSRGRASVLYFRAGLWVSVVALMLASLRAGFDPVDDVEIYSTPVAVLILIIAYLSLRRAWEEYDRDAGALLWVGSLLLCAPLLARAVEFRLLLDEAAAWRDLAVLIASLALILYGVVGRMRAPVLVGAISLITELSVLTLTSVDWLQVPLKYYLMTVGALLLIIFGTLEYRREQFLVMRKRFQERRDSVREQFGEWR